MNLPGPVAQKVKMPHLCTHEQGGTTVLGKGNKEF